MTSDINKMFHLIPIRLTCLISCGETLAFITKNKGHEKIFCVFILFYFYSLINKTGTSIKFYMLNNNNFKKSYVFSACV